jgi:hypothetical protein
MSVENSNTYWCALSDEEEKNEAIMVHLAEELQKTGYALGSKTIIAAVK